MVLLETASQSLRLPSQHVVVRRSPPRRRVSSKQTNNKLLSKGEARKVIPIHEWSRSSCHSGGIGAWHAGDSCLAPDPRDGTLRESTIQGLTTSHQGDAMARVVFTDNNKDEEEAVPVSKLVRPALNYSTGEKPMFPNSTIDPRLYVPLELGDGHRVPYTINRYLRDYQRDGIRFIFSNFMHSRGCILGDDVGLGKTVQVIGFLAALLHKKGTSEDIENNRPQFLRSQTTSLERKPNKVFLIVAPLSLLYNWKDELDTWGHFRCVVVHGPRKKEELARIKKGCIEIALTTYETLRICLDQFNSIDWSAVIVDEAHKIKNPNSQVTQAMKDLKCEIRIGLTGTILQNNVEELWCVMDWAIPRCLGTLGRFKTKYSDPIEQGQRHTASKRALATGRKTIEALVRKISHWFLRRTKALIKDQLPKKDDRVVYCTLTGFQQSVYETVLDTEDVTSLLRSSETCDCRSGRSRSSCCYKTGVKMKTLYFSYLAILRKVANHVALLKPTAGTSKKQEEYVGRICAKVFQKFPDFVQRCKDEAFEALSDPMYSGKMKVLQKLLKHYQQKRDKVLLFSLSTKLLDVLESYCMAEGLDYSRLDGNTKAKERVQIVREFNTSPHINLCLVSTMAGGLGLNFVGANVVVLFDPTWNPASDLQAIDRAYRIGQCRDVTILRLISLGTVEEIIYLRQIYKQQLQCSVVGKESSRRYFEAVQGHASHRGELFGIRNLFRLQTQGTCLTRKILEREGQVEAGVMTTSTHAGEEEEETKGVSNADGSRDSPRRDVPVLNYEPAVENKYISEVSREVLDFSSGSEEEEEGLKRKTSKPSVADGDGGGNAATGCVRLSLLQQGFSKLLERVKGKPEAREEDSSADESTVEESAEDQMKEGPPSSICDTGNDALCLAKLGGKTWDISSNSDREDKDDSGERRGLKGPANTRTTVDELLSRGKNKTHKLKSAAANVHHVEGYSDESEDLDTEEMERKNKRRGRLDRNRKRPSSSVGEKTRRKYTEDVTMFTSSEDEHSPVERGRLISLVKSPQMDRSGVESPKEGQRTVTAKSSGKQGGVSKAVSFTSLVRTPSPASKGKEATIDSVLGGAQEVMYTHSNQRVVGGSKAEELISRAAVRDVFERKMYSQLPANHVPDSIESPPDRPASSRLERPSVDHPVTFADRSVHHTRHATFIIGETPHAVRRQHLEEMATTMKFSSVHQFAFEILRRSSSERLAWLRQHYASRNHPDLAEIVANNFPQSDSAQTSLTSTVTKSQPGTRTLKKDVLKAHKKAKCTQDVEPKTKPEIPQNNVSVPQKKPTNPQNGFQEAKRKEQIPEKNILEPPGHVPGLESEEQEETGCRGHKRTKKGSVSRSGAFRPGGALGLDQACSSGLGSWEAAAFLNRKDRDTPSSSNLIHGRSTNLCKPTAQARERGKKPSRASKTVQGQRENPRSPSPPELPTSTSSFPSLLTDLIGDTSILNDLIKPKSRGTQKRNSPQTPPGTSSAAVSFTTPAPSSVSLDADSGSAGLLDAPSSPKSNKAARRQVHSKSGHKDFWDILNEGNEETINRLTDPAEVQRVCINTNVAVRSRSGGAEGKESTSLWKTNEKFLWKK
ncbi:DNA excision repair protein ERCC-6-like 2 [Brachionichthys hirsutus]|uniref:DNA excision repair protein ERCC-6-like 2 n=1 Tax=Brachionichthys hirsutus TaxID=412623 RepID=UPI0036053DFD